MSAINLDFLGHEVPEYPTSSVLAYGAVGTTAVGTISPTTAAGATPTTAAIAGTDCTDRRGRFTLNPVTGGGAQAAGVVAKVRFAKPYANPPAAVLLNLNNDTDTTATITVSSNAVTVAGFDICIGAVLTTAKVYKVDYFVIP
jgi:hypothetical protein